jgi:uncharacterized membrane protein
MPSTGIWRATACCASSAWRGESGMTKFLVAYAVTITVMLVLDVLWIGVIAKPLYQQGIGHLMAEQPRLGVAVGFYLMYAVGLVVFAVNQGGSAGDWKSAMLYGALFGFFAYATYDLTNLATLRNWPVSLALIDIAWGTAVSAVCAGAGRFALDRVAAAA